MLALGSFLILIQLFCVKSNVQNDMNINIVSTQTDDVTLVNPDAFVNGLFTKLANAQGLEKAVTVSYRGKRGFETSETSGKF